MKIRRMERDQEMEKDCVAAHGMAQFLKERMMDVSDIYSTHVCDKCGFFAQKVKKKNVYMCKQCENETEISKINLPYACKLLFQELMAMMIAPRIITQKDKYMDIV